MFVINNLALVLSVRSPCLLVYRNPFEMEKGEEGGLMKEGIKPGLCGTLVNFNFQVLSGEA